MRRSEGVWEAAPGQAVGSPLLPLSITGSSASPPMSAYSATRSIPPVQRPPPFRAAVRGAVMVQLRYIMMEVKDEAISGRSGFQEQDKW